MRYDDWDKLVDDMAWMRDRNDVVWRAEDVFGTMGTEVRFAGSDGSSAAISTWDLGRCKNRYGKRFVDTWDGRQAVARAVNCGAAPAEIESHVTSCELCGVARMLES